MIRENKTKKKRKRKEMFFRNDLKNNGIEKE
jgi:hypothetical protein